MQVRLSLEILPRRRSERERRRSSKLFSFERLEERTVLSADFEFAAVIGGVGEEIGRDVAVDANGSICYVL